MILEYGEAFFDSVALATVEKNNDVQISKEAIKT
ncbi:MAG: hypothetical protein ACI94Y_004390 [Maribacter sp.]